jgi:hypothetical protein
MKNTINKRGFVLQEAATYCGIPAKTIYEANRDNLYRQTFKLNASDGT